MARLDAHTLHDSPSNTADAEDHMHISAVIPQLRTTNLVESLSFYTSKLGFTLEFLADDFYAGVRAGSQIFHLKLVDEPDPSIAYVDHGDHFHLYFQTDDIAAVATMLKGNGVRLERDVHETAWGTRELILKDDQGHTLYFAQPL
jgi:catechol 2,3-dioxygenase-like lactoylglutathione lyase family enzyme